jgi:plastocyanin
MPIRQLSTIAMRPAATNLALQFLMVLGISLGMLLARRKRFRAHGRLQAAVVLLNIVLIVIIMIPSYRRQVVPNIGLCFQDSYYGMASVHAALGFAAQLLALYVVVVAGTSLLPKWLQFSNYKPWMRATLALWWVVFLVGCGTYYVWYVRAPANVAAAPPSAAAENRVTVTVKNFGFEPAQITVPLGTVVEWVDERGRHTVKADDGSFESSTLISGGKFERRFDKPGVYRYFCGFHGAPGGKDMAGTVTVSAR